MLKQVQHDTEKIKVSHFGYRLWSKEIFLSLEYLSFLKNKAIIQKNQYQAADESAQLDFKKGDEYTIKGGIG